MTSEIAIIDGDEERKQNVTLSASNAEAEISKMLLVSLTALESEKGRK